MNTERSSFVFEIDMSHAGLGALDESSAMVMLGNCHSRYLIQGQTIRPTEIIDANDNVLYPAYFMTHLVVSPQLALSTLHLWNKVEIKVAVRRYGDTVLDSDYALRPVDRDDNVAITMKANSLFILDPSIHRSQDRQVAAPRADCLRKMERLTRPPVAIQESAKVRVQGFPAVDEHWLIGSPYPYRLMANRDTSPDHPMIFAKFPLLMELSERHFLAQLTEGRIAEDSLHDVALLQRKIFYYGNAFAGDKLELYTKGRLEQCTSSLWKDNIKLQYLFLIKLQTEIYHNGQIIAVASADKVIVKPISDQASIQDMKRLFSSLSIQCHGSDVS